MTIKAKKTIINITICVLVLIAVIITTLIISGYYRIQERINAPIGGQFGPPIYCVGGSMDSSASNITFLSLKNNAAILSFTNKTEEEWEPLFTIKGCQAISGEIPYEDTVGHYHKIYTLTNKRQGCESDSLLYDALKFTIDGQENSSCIIPPDRKEHIVEIDYSYLNQNNIELNSDLYIDNDCFYLRYGVSE